MSPTAGAAERVLHQVSRGCVLEVAHARGEEAWDQVERAWKSCVKRTRKIMGWKREKNIEYGVADELLQRSHEEISACRREASSLLPPPAPEPSSVTCLTSSSLLILFPVCFRKTSSRLGVEMLIDMSSMSVLSKALTSSGTKSPPFFT